MLVWFSLSVLDNGNVLVNHYSITVSPSRAALFSYCLIHFVRNVAVDPCNKKFTHWWIPSRAFIAAVGLRLDGAALSMSKPGREPSGDVESGMKYSVYL